MSIRFTVAGLVREAESGIGVPGLFVKAYDRESRFEDLLGIAITNPDGSFEIVTESDNFPEFFERRPDLYLRIFAADRSTELWPSKEFVRWNAGRYEKFDVRIPRKSLGGHAVSPSINIIGHPGEPEAPLQPGDSLVLRAARLRPSASHLVTIRDNAGEIATQTLISDAQGQIRDTVVWPQLGIDDPRDLKQLPVEQARKRWFGQTITLTLRDADRTVGESQITLGKTSQPLAVATDAAGLLLNGFEVGDGDARLTLLDFGAENDLRIWMVPRQQEWHDDDPITPVLLSSGKPAQLDVRSQSDVQRVVVAARDQLVPGAYDFIIRRLRYGYEDDELVLRPTDMITNRYSTGLVVREKFMASKVIRGGCVNLQKIACRRTLGSIWPYIEFTDTFQVGSDVWGTLDPNAIDPTHAGKMIAMYVVPHKTAAQWTADNSLANLAILGGNAAVPKWLTQTWCVNANLHLLWPNATQVGDYDIVGDFGNNTSNPAAFIPDNQFNQPLDMIDGYIVPGFRIVPDPTSDTSFAYTGHFSYDETTQGYIDVVDDGGNPWHVPLKASVYFPADVHGATTPAQISSAQPNYPLVVVVHGNGPLGGYLGYEYLLPHFAANGFIAASIHMEPGEQGTDRARVLRKHLQILFGMFGAQVANNVGLMGHSRGGEAVVIAARLNQQEAWGFNINAVISLAPTNQYTSEHFGGAWAAPYLVIYGSLDGDLAGIADTGFELYDHASGLNKSMAFVYRSCHDRYNTVWDSGDLGFGQLTPTDQAAVLSDDSHHKIAMGYMAAFFRQHLSNQAQWAAIFRGEWVPAAVEASDANMKIYVQYEDTIVRTVDDFEGAHTATSWQSDSLGGAVTQVGLPATPQDNDLRTMDAHSPHLTGGLLLRWDNTTESLRYSIPAGQQDVSAFQAVSFRITQRVDSASDPVNQAQDLRLTLTDGGGNSRAIRISKIAEIPYPYVRGFDVFTKSAMCTIRIPLAAYTIHCYNVNQVDLTNITSLEFDFAETPTGEIEIDSIQFTN